MQQRFYPRLGIGQILVDYSSEVRWCIVFTGYAVLDPYRDQIKEYLQLGLSLSRIRTIINPQLGKPISYPSYRYFVRQDMELLELWQAQRKK